MSTLHYCYISVTNTIAVIVIINVTYSKVTVTQRWCNTVVFCCHSMAVTRKKNIISKEMTFSKEIILSLLFE
jgi:hypothetical protein